MTLEVSSLLFAVGTKNVARELKKVSAGRIAAKGKTWFPELADKRMLYLHVCKHIYTCMLMYIQEKVQKHTFTGV